MEIPKSESELFEFTKFQTRCNIPTANFAVNILVNLLFLQRKLSIHYDAEWKADNKQHQTANAGVMCKHGQLKIALRILIVNLFPRNSICALIRQKKIAFREFEYTK